LMALPLRLRRRTAVAALAGFFYPPSPNPLENAWHWALFDLAELFFNVFPVPRARGFRESLRYAGFLVENGWNILIFPEGTRSPTGELTPFREGIGLLASELKVPVVPFRIHGTYEILPRGAWIPRPGPVVIRFGKPMCFPPTSYWEITRQVEKAVANL
jgi:long-chain acyl-CoA synthetase